MSKKVNVKFTSKAIFLIAALMTVIPSFAGEDPPGAAPLPPLDDAHQIVNDVSTTFLHTNRGRAAPLCSEFCFSRAHVMAGQIQIKDLDIVGYLQIDLTELGGNWDYHVAPLFRVKDYPETTFIMDPLSETRIIVADEEGLRQWSKIASEIDNPNFRLITPDLNPRYSGGDLLDPYSAANEIPNLQPYPLTEDIIASNLDYQINLYRVSYANTLVQDNPEITPIELRNEVTAKINKIGDIGIHNTLKNKDKWTRQQIWEYLAKYQDTLRKIEDCE